ncbi:hypothetical protein [Nocardioides kribbensis]|uniref:VanZ family protein n=1 Tax=Nocardioides kribbensis TaxID=305517 RepID=A0ABV1NUW0_9ACTN
MPAAPTPTTTPTTTPVPGPGHRLHRLLPVLVLLLTVGQLAVAQWVPGIERFEGKAFGARLLAYPVLMLVVPAVWWLASRRRPAADRAPAPYAATTLVMLPFLVDVTGNSLDLYDAVVWWDDANHLVNWALLCGGLGLLVAPTLPRGWQVVLVVTGIGAVLAIAWEAGEWLTFIRHGTEVETAYEDTLGDEVLGTLGAFAAGVALALTRRRARSQGW